MERRVKRKDGLTMCWSPCLERFLSHWTGLASGTVRQKAQ